MIWNINLLQVPISHQPTNPHLSELPKYSPLSLPLYFIPPANVYTIKIPLLNFIFIGCFVESKIPKWIEEIKLWGRTKLKMNSLTLKPSSFVLQSSFTVFSSYDKSKQSFPSVRFPTNIKSNTRLGLRIKAYDSSKSDDASKPNGDSNPPNGTLVSLSLLWGFSWMGVLCMSF